MTKKLISILLAVLMLMTYVTPVMALPLDLNPLEDVVEGSVSAPVEEPAEPNAPVGIDKGKSIVIKAPVCDCGSDACDVAVEVWQSGAKLTTLTKGSADYKATTTQQKPITLKAINGTCGYEFTKWTMTGDTTAYGTKVNNAEIIIAYKTSISLGATYTANFKTAAEPSTYTVTYTDGVEGAAFANQVYKDLAKDSATPAFNGTPAREGYKFAGWQPEVAATVTADATYTAQWEEDKSVARLESTGAEYETLASAFAAAQTAMVNGPQTVTLLKDVNESVSVTWATYSSLKYDYDLTFDLNGKTVTGKSGSVFTFKRTGNYEVGKMNITFNDSVGTGVVTGGNAVKGGAINIDSQYGCTKLVINGGKFTGNSASDKGGAIYAGLAKGTTDPKRTVEVVLAGGEITGNTAPMGGGVVVWNNISILTQTGCKVYGNTATTQGDDIVYRSNYSSSSANSKMSLAENAWFVDKTGARYSTGTRVPFTKWANYTEKGNASEIGLKYVEPTYFTVTYTDGVADEEVFADQTYKVLEGEATPAFNGTPSREGYKFLGWEPAVAEKVTADVTYTAQWEESYTVTYTDGAEGAVFADQVYEVKLGDATPAFNGDLTREGYKFLGWQPEVAETVTGTVVYTAQWEAIKYKLTFNGNGTNQLSGTYSGSYTSKTKYTVGTNVNLTAAMDGKKFTKALSEDYSTNYRQIGWNTKKDGTGTHYAMNGTFVMPAADTVLYAEWEAYEWTHWNVQMSDGGDHITYTTKLWGPTADVQSFKAYTGNVGTGAGKVPAALYTPVKAVAKEGYRFIGWYDVEKNNCISTNESLFVQDFRNLRALKLAESGSVLEARFEAKKTSNIHVVIYKASDLSKPVVSKAVTNLYDGDVFTPNIADYYSSANGYEFVGWFNDGNFNNYKAGKSYTEATEFTVTGNWQNVIAVVTDYEKVVVKAVYDGDKENAQTVYTGLALHGSNVIEFLEANAGVGEVEGYELDKWYNWDWYGHKVAENATVNGWTNVYVTYTRNVFTVTYTDGVEGEEVFADQSYQVKYGEATPAFDGTPERTGYTFKGWEPAVAETVTEDVTYTAQWEAIKYKITFNGNGAKLSNVVAGTYTPTTRYTMGTSVNLNTAMGGKRFVKNLSDDYSTNYRQTGWNTKADGTGEHYAMNGTLVMPASDVTLYAEWEGYEWWHWNVRMGEGGQSITYGTGSGKHTVESYKMYVGNTGNQAGVIPVGIYCPVVATPKEGYNFVGWYDVENEKLITTGNIVTGTVRNNKDLKLSGTRKEGTLEARFELKDVTVTYDDGVNGAAFAAESHTVKYGDPTPAFEGSLENYIGWVFNGWNPAVADKVTGDVTYTAKWRMKGANTVIYYGNEGELSNGNTFWSEYTNAQTKVLSSNTGYYEFARTGWHFTGWNTKADGTGESYAAGATYTFTAAHNLETVELYAQWERNTYTVTYVDGVNGAAFATESHTAKYEDATPAFEGSLENYIGWVFNGWTPAVADKVTGDVTYTAKWRMKGANTLYYYGNGGATEGKFSSTSYSEYTNAASITVKGNGTTKFVRDEYKFIGWNTKADGTGTAYPVGSTYNFEYAHNLEKGYLYAQWEHIACDKHLEDVKVITEPTCTEDGLKLCRCTVCGKEVEVVIPALGHDHSGKWTWNREDHWKKCTRCGEILDLHEHIYGEWKSIDNDREERSCTVCGFTQYAQIIHIGGNTTTKPTDEENPNTGAEVIG